MTSEVYQKYLFLLFNIVVKVSWYTTCNIIWCIPYARITTNISFKKIRLIVQISFHLFTNHKLYTFIASVITHSKLD